MRQIGWKSLMRKMMLVEAHNCFFCLWELAEASRLAPPLQADGVVTLTMG